MANLPTGRPCGLATERRRRTLVGRRRWKAMLVVVRKLRYFYLRL